MSKINLLTIHWGCSYGGTLQTYSTIKLLESLGHQVTLINLVHPNSTFKAKYKSLYSLWDSGVYVSFSKFRRMYFPKMTKKMFQITASKIPSCDYYVVGSDQVWNDNITTSLKKSYFLDFVDETPRISLSSSFGKDTFEWSQDYQKFVSDALRRFKAVSVREASGVALCRDYLNVTAIQLLDPTLLWGQFNDIDKVNKGKKQIFPFIFKKSEEVGAITKKISSTLGLPIFSYSYYARLFGRSPQAWLDNMKNSDFIITDSFHGLAFSLMFHKRFVVLCADKQMFTRLQSLLELFNLEERYVSSLTDLNNRIHILKKEIDYSRVDSILNEKRGEAISFLRRVLD